MKIEFRKVPRSLNNFKDELLSVKIEGTFCKISPKLVELDFAIDGIIDLDCSICGKSFHKQLNEKNKFLLSDGNYKPKDKNLDTVVIEIFNHEINFQDLIKGEIESFKSDYHICDNCN